MKAYRPTSECKRKSGHPMAAGMMDVTRSRQQGGEPSHSQLHKTPLISSVRVAGSPAMWTTAASQITAVTLRRGCAWAARCTRIQSAAPPGQAYEDGSAASVPNNAATNRGTRRATDGVIGVLQAIRQRSMQAKPRSAVGTCQAASRQRATKAPTTVSIAQPCWYRHERAPSHTRAQDDQSYGGP